MRVGPFVFLVRLSVKINLAALFNEMAKVKTHKTELEQYELLCMSPRILPYIIL